MKTKIKIGGGLWLLAAFAFLGGYKYMNFKILLPWIFAVIIHEMGHFAAALLFGAKIEKMVIEITGAKMSFCGKLLSYKEELFIALSGPLVNFFTSAVSFEAYSDLSEISLMLGIINLIPAPGFDGCRILSSFIAQFFGAVASEKTMKLLSFFSVIFLWLLSVYGLLKFGSSFSLFIISCMLFLGFVKQ